MVTEAAPVTETTEPQTPPVEQVVSETPATEVAAVAQPAAETPAPLATAPVAAATPPSLPAISPSNLPPEVQEYVTRLEQQAQSAREQSELQTLNQTVAQYSQQLQTQYGLTAEQADIVAKTQGDILYKQYQSEQLNRGKVRAAISIAKEFGVDPMQLLDLTSPQAMRQAAQAASATTKQAEENTQLRARIAALEKGRVPAQTFAQGAQPGAGAGLTGDTLETAWLKHETEQPDKPNPYDSAYRAMLRG